MFKKEYELNNWDTTVESLKLWAPKKFYKVSNNLKGLNLKIKEVLNKNAKNTSPKYNILKKKYFNKLKLKDLNLFLN